MHKIHKIFTKVSRWFHLGGDPDWPSMSFRGHSRPARSFQHKIDCSAETVADTAKVTRKSYVAPSSMTLEHVQGRTRRRYVPPVKKLFKWNLFAAAATNNGVICFLRVKNSPSPVRFSPWRRFALFECFLVNHAPAGYAQYMPMVMCSTSPA